VTAVCTLYYSRLLDSLESSGDGVAYVRSSSRLLGVLFRLISFAILSCLWRRLSQVSGEKTFAARTCKIPNLISHSPFTDSLVVSAWLRDCVLTETNICSEQNFVEGTLVHGALRAATKPQTWPRIRSRRLRQDSAFSFRTRIRSQKYVKKRSRSHFSISAAAEVCVVTFEVKTGVNLGCIDSSRILNFERFPDPD